MALNYEFQQLFGGLHTAILPYNRMDPVHRSSLGNILRDTIKYEAKVHGAAFDHVGFRNVTRALASGDIEVLFFAATWDVCEPKIIGATINFRSLFMERDGNNIKTGYGLYTEDVCLLTPKLRELIDERSTGCMRPKISLGEHFQQQGLRYFAENGMTGGVFPVGGTYEYAPSNTKIIRNQQAIGSLVPEKPSGLMRIEGLTPAMQDKMKVPVEVLDVILPNGTIDPRNFLINWSGTNDRQKINVGLTLELSSFVGNNITQCQIISNGNLPSQSVVESVVASSLAMAEHKIQSEGLGIQQHQRALRNFSPSIPLLGSAKEMHEALFELGGAEIATNNTPRVSSGRAIPAPTHIHVKNDEPEILEALHALGAKQRMLGPNPMLTGSINLTDRLEAAGTAEKVRLRLISREVTGVQFGIAA